MRLHGRRVRGLTLVEVTVSMAIFALVAAMVSTSLSLSMRGSGEQTRSTEAIALLRSFQAELQRRANSTSPALGPASLFSFCLNGASAPTSTGWAVGNPFHNSSAAYALNTRLKGPGPAGEATIVCRAYKNETNNSSGNPANPYYSAYSPRIPAELGGPNRDLNMDGDFDDECLPDDLKVVPIQITLTYREVGRGGFITRTVSIYTLITRTAG